MNKIAIILNGEGNSEINETYYTYIIAVDGGSNYLSNKGIKPDLIIGDLDSIDASIRDVEILQFPTEKDDTDFELSIKYIKENFVDYHIDVYNYKSTKRIEHFYANLMLIDTNITFVDKDTTISFLTPGRHEFANNDKYVSFFAYPYATNIKTKGFKYNVYNFNLNFNDNLMISNQMVDDRCFVSFEKGAILMFVSEDDASNR